MIDPLAAAHLCELAYTRMAGNGTDLDWRDALGRILTQDDYAEWRGSKNLPQYQQHGLFFKNDMKGFWVADSTTVNVVVRGTHSLINWFTNLVRRPTWNVPYSDYGYAHRGYVASADAIYDDIGKLILDLASEGRELNLMGHSMGGAVAGCLSTFFADRYQGGCEAASCLMYGSPRWASPILGRRLQENRTKYCRFSITDDIVPMLPIFGFKHVGQYVYFARDTFPQNEPAFRFTAIDRLSTLFRDWRFWKRHSMDEYISHMEMHHERVTKLLARV